MVSSYPYRYHNLTELERNIVHHLSSYEAARGITLKNQGINRLGDDLAIITCKASNDETSIYIAYKIGGFWVWWLPTDNQLSHFPTIFDFYAKVDREDHQNKEGAENAI